jgi:hypothetical protein
MRLLVMRPGYRDSMAGGFETNGTVNINGEEVDGGGRTGGPSVT